MSLIARCPGCNTTAPVVERIHLITQDPIQVFAPHGDCRGGSEAGEVLADTPANREALAAKWIGKRVCPECCQRPIDRRGQCETCADQQEKMRLAAARSRRRGRR